MALKPKWLKRDLVGFSLASFFNDFSHEMTTVLLPTFTESLVGIEKAPSVLGMVSGISKAAESIMRLISGWLNDRISRHKWLLIIGYALTPLFSALIGTAYYVWQMVTYKTIAWAGRGLREPPRDAWLAKIIPPAYYGKAFGFQRALDTLGAIVGPLVVFFILSYFPLRTIFLISLIPGIFSVASIIFFTSEQEEKPVYQSSSFVNQFKELPLPFIYFIGVRLIFGIGNFDKTFIILRAQELLSGTASSSLIATSWAIALYVLFNLIRALGEYSIGSLSDYISRKNLLAVLGFGLFGLMNAILFLMPSSIVWWMLIFTVAGLSTAAITSLEKSYSADLLPARVRGLGYGVLEASDGIGMLIANITVGFLWSSWGASYGFVYAGILSLVAMILLLIKPRSIK